MWSRAHRKFARSWLTFRPCCRELIECPPEVYREVRWEFADRLLGAHWKFTGRVLGVYRRRSGARRGFTKRMPGIHKEFAERSIDNRTT
ncbi:hypothetical protein BHM03_00042373 [Ensete ventricosum]|nr:hypothetical protein BHM03_00042373 [Ensete ventricosum]